MGYIGHGTRAPRESNLDTVQFNLAVLETQLQTEDSY